jgi:carbamoyl-phosphate synthase large subunit
MNILVTAISGNLSQSICTLIKKYFNSYIIIGTDSESPMQGYGLCHKLFKLPYAYEKNYIKSIHSLVEENRIDLIIPCNDLELEQIMNDIVLSKIALASPIETIVSFSDKYLSYELFKKYDLNFCKTYLPSDYRNQFNQIIVKPRKGSGSKNIHINPKSISQFDDTYVVQDFKLGTELTIPFYVNLNNELIGCLPLVKYGKAPNNCYQTYNENKTDILEILTRIKEIAKIKGPCNFQCIINDDGIHPFEINCRYSGSVDIQDKLGFNILEIGVNEFLLNKTFSDKLLLQNGFAIRQYISQVFIGDKMELGDYATFE